MQVNVNVECTDFKVKINEEFVPIGTYDMKVSVSVEALRDAQAISPDDLALQVGRALLAKMKFDDEVFKKIMASF